MSPVIVELLSKFNYSDKSELKELCENNNSLIYCESTSKKKFQELNKLANNNKIICKTIRISLDSEKEFNRFLDNTKNLDIYFIIKKNRLKFNPYYDNIIYISDNPQEEILNALYEYNIIKKCNYYMPIIYFSTFAIIIGFSIIRRKY